MKGGCSLGGAVTCHGAAKKAALRPPVQDTPKVSFGRAIGRMPCCAAVSHPSSNKRSTPPHAPQKLVSMANASRLHPDCPPQQLRVQHQGHTAAAQHSTPLHTTPTPGPAPFHPKGCTVRRNMSSRTVHTVLAHQPPCNTKPRPADAQPALCCTDHIHSSCDSYQ